MRIGEKNGRCGVLKAQFLYINTIIDILIINIKNITSR